MANICTAITVEGIMQQSVGSGPIQAGISLYHGLASVSSVALLTDQKEKDIEHWLKVENLIKHDVLLTSDFAPSIYSRRLAQVTELRKRGFNVALVFDPDPSVCSALILGGFNACCFMHTSYADPKWRPDYDEPVKPWDELEFTVTQQKLARLEDERLRQKDVEVNES